MSLPDQLRDAADQPIETPNLLPRARAARSRRRLAGIAAGAAATTVTVALAAAWLPIRPDVPAVPLPADASSSAPPAGPVDQALTAERIVEICTPQMAAYEGHPRFLEDSASSWALLHPERAYELGDLVSLVPENSTAGASLPRLCILDEDGSPNPLETLRPTADAAWLPAFASELETNLIPKLEGSTTVWESVPNPVPDLSEATVVHASEAKHVVATILELDGRRYGAVVSPQAYDFGTQRIVPLELLEPSLDIAFDDMLGGPAGKSIGPDGAFHTGVGRLPDGAAKIVFSGPADAEVPVVDGAYAFVVHVPGATTLEPLHYQVLDGAGKVLHEGQSRS